jgi:hypothetical protein
MLDEQKTRDLLHARLDCRALPNWCGASSTRVTSSPATGTAMSAPASRGTADFSADIRLAPRRCSKTRSGAGSKGLSRTQLFGGEGNLWAFDCLQRAGYRYSSSIYPIRHDHYGMPDAPRFAHQVRAGLLETAGDHGALP